MNQEQRDELEAMAQQASPDIEAMLVQLDRLAALRRKDPEVERRYEQLRDELAGILGEEGPRFYLDDKGVKRVAYRVQPEKIQVDIAKLNEMAANGEIDEELLERVAPRKADLEALRSAVAAGRMTSAQLLKVARMSKGTAHVRFSDPFDAS